MHSAAKAPDENDDAHRPREQPETAQETEARYRNLVDMLPDGIAVHQNGRLVFSNPAGAKLLGAAGPEELVGKPLTEIIHPDNLQAARERIQRMLWGETGLYPVEDRYLTLDGSVVPVEVMATPIVYEGQPAVQVVVRDIRERKEAERRLRQSEELFATAFRASPGALAISRARDGTFIDVNERFCQLHEYAREEVIGHDWHTLRLFPDSNEIATIGRLARERGALRDMEVTVQTKTGRHLDMLFSTEQIILDGEVCFLTIFFDITERKQAEQARMKLEAQLRQSQKMESIGHLTGGIAHDFNNMLSAIVGFISTAQELIDSDHPAHHDLENAKSAAWRAARLTRQLLTFARQDVVVPRVLNLNSVVEDLERLLRRLIGEDIELVTLTAPDLHQVLADVGQIEQVITNIVMNARDAMPNGGTLIIETANVSLDTSYTRQHTETSPGEYIMLAVSDTGSGMDAEMQEHIFEPFFTTKEVGKGTGLGLATCYGIVKQHGGSIEVYSEVGQGTTFTIYLPAIRADVDRLPATDTRSAPPHGTETVLLVEDEPLVRNVAHRVLQAYGYTVLVAEDGKEALRVLGEHTGSDIALLITDLVMPRMSGKMLAEHVRAQLPNIRVLFLSGYAPDSMIHNGRLDAGTNFLPKPFAPEALARKVRAVLDAEPSPDLASG